MKASSSVDCPLRARSYRFALASSLLVVLWFGCGCVGLFSVVGRAERLSARQQAHGDRQRQAESMDQPCELSCSKVAETHPANSDDKYSLTRLSGRTPFRRPKSRPARPLQPASRARASDLVNWLLPAVRVILVSRSFGWRSVEVAVRPLSKVAPDWWDYTTLDREILDDAARLTADDLAGLARAGFAVKFYDTLEDFYLAEALEYITAWRQATADRPAGICGPIGPTEQLPLVARLVNELDLEPAACHFWGMDEWAIDGREVARRFSA